MRDPVSKQQTLIVIGICHLYETLRHLQCETKIRKDRMQDQSKYGQRGVSHAKTDVHNAIKNIDKGLFPNAFCKVMPDILGKDEQYCMVMHADGAGTKSSLAYLYWKETGDISVGKGIAQDAIVMNLDAGQDINNAEAEFAAAVAHYDAQKWKLAYARFRKAYREAVRP